MRALTAVVASALVALACGCGSSGSSDAGGDAATTHASTTTAPAPAAATASGACAATARAPSKVPGAPLDTILRVPAGARGHRAPLVLALHFAGGTGAEMEQATRYTPEARRSSFVVAYPTASHGHFWGIDNDLRALTRTLDAIERAACIDPRRVYVSGISNGGFMGTVLACRMADRVAAVALFAPGVTGIGSCSPARPISVLEVHGTADPIVPYGGSGGDAATAIPNFVAAWARRDGCSSALRSRQLGATVTVLTWPGCRAGADVEHLRLSGGRHIELLPQLRAANVDPARTAWRFLAAHRLPA